MPENIAAIRTALRVLTAMTDKVYPEPNDLEKLLRLAPGLLRSPYRRTALGGRAGAQNPHRFAAASGDS